MRLQCIDIFCFKQKTAYELRISDGSSDVCSSDLSAYPRMAIRLMFAIRQLARSRWTRPWPKAWAKRPHRAVRVWKSCAIDLRPHQQPRKLLTRSEERRAGKECVSTGRSRWATSH